MKKTYIVFIFSGLPLVFLFAQTPAQVDTTLDVVPLQEMVISANRASQSRTAVAQQVTVLRRASIETANAQTTAELLSNTAGIFVQKSQQGGGSPVLRGFEANRVLLVVDGVRMNNAIYRGGHLQNIITMDNAVLDRAEILFGPASTVYGSDALGGAICFFTKNPSLAPEGKNVLTTGSAFVRYGSVNEEKTAHLDLSLGGRRFGALSSFTFSDFGDLKMGARTGSRDAFGERPFYVDRINGVDSLVANPDPLVQRFSGYRQYDFMEKILFQASDRVSHSLNLQYSTSSDIPRYDRLTDPDPTTGLRNAQWYYGPQERALAAYKFALDQAGWFDQFRTTLSWQGIEESRHQRRFNRTGLQHRTETVRVYGLEAEARKAWGQQTLQVGLDAQFNDVQSEAVQENIQTGAGSALDTRYPDGGSTMYTAALFATHSWQAAGSDKWTFSEGLRAGVSGLKSQFTERTFFPFPFDEVEQNNFTWSANAGIVWRPSAQWRLALNGSTGFRVPNVDDMGKVFESAPGNLIVPNPDLKPETTWNLDLNITHQLNDRLRWENVLWVTRMQNAIVTDAFQFNGADSVEYDGVLSRVLANQNKRKAGLWGFNSTLEADITSAIAAYAGVTYTRGRILETEGDRPLDHIPPVGGRVGLRFHTQRWLAEGYAVFQGKKDLDDYFLNGEDNEQYAPADGMPAWVTLNLRAGYRIHRLLTVQIGVDNLLDRQYRVFASGINAPGRNIFVTLRSRF